MEVHSRRACQLDTEIYRSLLLLAAGTSLASALLARLKARRLRFAALAAAVAVAANPRNPLCVSHY